MPTRRGTTRHYAPKGPYPGHLVREARRQLRALRENNDCVLGSGPADRETAAWRVPPRARTTRVRMSVPSIAARGPDDVSEPAGTPERPSEAAWRAYRALVHELPDTYGRDEAVRLIRQLGEHPLSTALAKHCGQHCSVTGVQVHEILVGGEPGVPELARPPWVSPSPAETPATFIAPAPRAGSAVAAPIVVTLTNVLGARRPFLPVWLTWSYGVGLGSARCWIPSSRSVFCYALVLAPGTSTRLSLTDCDLWRELPCPRGLVHQVRFEVGFPTARKPPSPVASRGQATRLWAA